MKTCMTTITETLVCIGCDEEIESPHLSGKTLVGEALLDYHLCYECFKDVPSRYEGEMQSQKGNDKRARYWDELRDKLKYKYRYSI